MMQIGGHLERHDWQPVYIPMLRWEAGVCLLLFVYQQLGNDRNQVTDSLATACFSCYYGICTIK